MRNKPTFYNNLLKSLYSTFHPAYRLVAYNYRKARFAYRKITAKSRKMPDFIIAGAMKCGTSSLYRYMTAHPLVLESLRKEVCFFDLNYEMGIDWYKAHFSIDKEGYYNAGDASPYYIFHPHVPLRVHQLLPSVKLIFLLRNPIKRAYSHYCYNVRKNREPLSFEEAIASEEERIGEAALRMQKDEKYFDKKHRLYSYKARGRYIEQIRRWAEIFPKEQMIFIKTEDMSQNTFKVVNEVFEFIGLKPMSNINIKKYNVNRYEPMSKETANEIRQYFKPYNEELYCFLKKDFDWD